MEAPTEASSCWFDAKEHEPTREGDARVPATPTELELLASELRARGFETHLVTPAGKRPYLRARNPRARVLAENIVTEAGWYWYSWAERIAQVGEVVTASEKITRVLRAVGSECDPAT